MHLFGQVKSAIARVCGRVRRRSAMVSVIKVVVLLIAFVLGALIHDWSIKNFGFPFRDVWCRTRAFGIAPAVQIQPYFPPPENTSYRLPDSIDTFKNYKYRDHPDCNISSQHLHVPFSPLCSNRGDLLAALSGGGRIGFDAPFVPRGCDMRWYTTEEICDILSRFERVIVVGDSMMRHIIGAMNVLLRKDLGYGAVTNWNFSEDEAHKCFCNHQMDVKACSVQGIYSTASVHENDPSSLACHQPIDLVIELMIRFPLDPIEVERFKRLIDRKKPAKPYAFIFGHGLWNDLDLQATLNWLDMINQHAVEQGHYLQSSSWPRLMVTPNAAGVKKPDQWISTQGDKALQIFERSVHNEVAKRGIDHLGTWNMSIQSTKYDGVHLDLRGNLVKAMSVINWLAMIDSTVW